MARRRLKRGGGGRARLSRSWRRGAAVIPCLAAGGDRLALAGGSASVWAGGVPLRRQKLGEEVCHVVMGDSTEARATRNILASTTAIEVEEGRPAAARQHGPWPAAPVGEAISVAPRPWGSLPEELVELIGLRVLADDMLGYVRFRAVCAHWNSSTIRPRGRGLLDPRFHPRRWLMFPEGHDLYPGHPNLGGYVRFFNLDTGDLVRVHLPLFDDHVILDSVDGLLLLLRHPGTTIRLLHPFTGEIGELPPLSSLLCQIEPRALRNCMTEERLLRQVGIFLQGVSAGVAISATGGITVMLSLHMIPTRRVAYATVGDQQWTLSDWKLPSLAMALEPLFFRGKLYVTSNKPEDYQDDNVLPIYRIDPPQPIAEGSRSLSLPPPVMIAECPVDDDFISTHLVECGLELMVVNFRKTRGAEIVVYRLTDLIGGRVVPVRNIGEHALFLGERALCVSTNKGLPCFWGNTIICINFYTLLDSQVDHYLLSSETWSPAMDRGLLTRNRTPASPYMLAHHIFTCCYPTYWNKGLIFCSAVTPNWSVKPNLWIQG